MNVACKYIVGHPIQIKHRDEMGGGERATDSIPLHAQDALQLPPEW